MPVKIFFCYAHEDESLLNKLKAHLKPLQKLSLIDVWYDRDMSAGTVWEEEINRNLNEANVILLLISPDFMNSDYCYGVEMKHAIQRHEQGEACVIPIILRHVYWQVEPLSKLQALPTDAKPVTDPDWHNLDIAFFNVITGIHEVINGLLAQEEQSGNDREIVQDLRNIANTEINTKSFEGTPKQQGQEIPAIQSEISASVSSTAYAGIGALVSFVLSYGNNLLIQRSLGAEAFGLYSVGMSIVMLLVPIFTFGADSAMLRFVSIYRTTKQTNLLKGLILFFFAVIGGTGLLGAIFMLSFAPFLATIRKAPDVVPVLQVMTPLVPLLCIQELSNGALHGFRETKTRMWHRIFVSVLLFFLLAGTLLYSRNVFAVTTVMIVSTLIGAGISLYSLFRVASRNINPEPETFARRAWITFALSNYFTTFIDTVLGSIDVLLLAFFAISEGAIGQYSAAIKISGFIWVPSVALSMIFAPIIAELYAAGEKQKLEAIFKVITKWTLTFGLPVFGVVTLFPVLLLSPSGNTFVAAWPLLIVIAVGGLMNIGTGPVGLMLLISGRQRLMFFNSLVAVTISLVLAITLTPHYGAIGIAISTVIAVCVVNFMKLLQVSLVLKMQPYRWDTLKPVASGLISAAITGSLLYLAGLTNWSIPHELVLIPVFLGTYIGFLVLFKIAPEDKIVLNSVRKKLRQSKK